LERLETVDWTPEDNRDQPGQLPENESDGRDDGGSRWEIAGISAATDRPSALEALDNCLPVV
jgi:hypothetical protein